MLVDLVVLRLEGRKRPAEELRRTPPLRVELTVEKGIARIATPGAADERRVTLANVRLVKVTADAFVLAGEQSYDLPDRGTVTYPQSWWCRPVMAG
jgi:hypothetical protein